MPFTFVSGNLALDFAGTVRNRDTAPRDLLSAPRLLREWSGPRAWSTPPPEVSEAEFAAPSRSARPFTAWRWPWRPTASAAGATSTW